VLGRGIARHGHPVELPGPSGDGTGEPVGRVTSGTHCPTLDRAVAMALVRSDLAAVGTDLVVRVRGRPLSVRVVDLPFYRREKR